MKTALYKILILLCMPLIFLTGCFGGSSLKASSKNNEETKNQAETEAETETEASAEITSAAEAADEASEDKEGYKNMSAEEILSEMTLDEKICQLFFVSPEQLTGEDDTVISADKAVKTALEAYPVGGIIYFSNNLETRDQTAAMIRETNAASKIPLFIGVDEEGGTVARVGSNPAMGTTALPPMAEIGETDDPQKAYEAGAAIAADISQLGFNVDFAPVADIITNPNNTEIGNRSFSSDPEICSRMVSEAVRGIQGQNVSACCKHFPGHGSTEANSHTGYSESSRTLEELKETELKPFEAGIAAGTDFIMVSHMTAVNIDSLPCSLSKKIISVLKDDLGYSGIVITDAQNMQAVTDFYTAGEAATLALEAGADMVLMPSELSEAVEGVKTAVNSGELSEEEIDERVLKILKLKERKGLI